MVSPSTFIRFPVSEVYQVFNGEVSLFYKNNKVRKNSGIEMRNACLKRAIELYNDTRVCPFSYILIPSTWSKDDRMFRVISGQRFNGRAGSGITQELKNVDGKFQLIGTYDDWRN